MSSLYVPDSADIDVVRDRAVDVSLLAGYLCFNAGILKQTSFPIEIDLKRCTTLIKIAKRCSSRFGKGCND